MDGMTLDDDFGPFPGRAKLLSDQNIVCSRVYVFSICNKSKYNYSVLSLCLLDTSAAFLVHQLYFQITQAHNKFISLI